MSRIGKKPIALPKGVTVKVNPDALDIQGPKGKLTQRIPPGIAFEVIDGQLKAAPMREDPELGKFHGLARSLAANGVLGVTEGFKRELDIVGVGYRAELQRQAGRVRARVLAPGRVRRADRHRHRHREADPS